MGLGSETNENVRPKRRLESRKHTLASGKTICVFKSNLRSQKITNYKNKMILELRWRNKIVRIANTILKKNKFGGLIISTLGQTTIKLQNQDCDIGNIIDT